MPEPVRKEQLDTLATSLRLIASKASRQDGATPASLLFPLRQEALLFMGCTARLCQVTRLMMDSAPRWTSLS
jgi:hypothetical protein